MGVVMSEPDPRPLPENGMACEPDTCLNGHEELTDGCPDCDRIREEIREMLNEAPPAREPLPVVDDSDIPL